MVNVEIFQNVVGGVGTSGERLFMFYAEVTDKMKVGAGGGMTFIGHSELTGFCIILRFEFE